MAEVAVLVVNQSPKPTGNSSPILYRLYRKLDRIFFKSEQDAFDRVSIFSICKKETPILNVAPIQKKFSDSFLQSDVETIESLKLDLVLRFGFRILRGTILNAAKWGVWSYHHGDPAVYKGGPPTFWEVMNQLPTTGISLIRLTEKLDEGPILYQSWTQTDPLSVQRNANRIFWQSSFFVARVLKRLEQGKSIELVSSTTKTKHPSPLWKPPGTLSTLSLVSSLLVRNALRRVNEFIHPPHWQIGWVGASDFRELEKDENRKVNWLHPSQKKDYWADPFCITVRGQEFVFVEAFDKVTQKGRIDCILPDGASITVLEESWHLSYPFVFEEKGEFYLIPESAEAGKINRYRAVDFPSKWERMDVFFPHAGYDPTLWKDETGYWLFVNQKAHLACSPFDELFLYHSPTLENPQWTSHPQNPIVSDVRRSRPAGRLFIENGKLYRPAQDSGIRYGHGIQIHEVKVLSKETYMEEPVSVIYPNSRDSFLGMHTLNRKGKGFLIDFYFRR